MHVVKMVASEALLTTMVMFSILQVRHACERWEIDKDPYYTPSGSAKFKQCIYVTPFDEVFPTDIRNDTDYLR